MPASTVAGATAAPGVIPSQRLANLAARISRITVWRNDPDRFFADRDDARREALAISKLLERQGQ